MADRSSRTLFYFCNVGWFFISHRLALAKAAKAQGYDVHVACDIESSSEVAAIEAADLRFHRIHLSRGGINPLADARTFLAMLGLLLRHRPALTHNISIKPVLYGSIAARIARIGAVVNAVSGLGYVFTDSRRAGSLRGLVRGIYRIALGYRRVCVIFQNRDDMRHFVEARLVRHEQTVLIAGSGVDLTTYTVAPEPQEGMVRIVLPARMLADKGVREFAGAARLLQQAGLPVDCILAGSLDVSNPAALSEAEIRELEASGAVRWVGHVADMPRLFRESHIVCLPSYREGLPKALIEACAAGRPIVATDVPGCHDVVNDGVNGLLVPPRNAQALHRALAQLVSDRSLRISMGASGRQIAEARFGLEQVVDRTMSLYRELAPLV